MKINLVWYCLRSQPKHEHIAAAHLALIHDVEVYCPRVRIQRMTRRGPVWFTEALFPSYLFCRFDRAQSQKAVTYAQGVSSIVRFGIEPATISDSVIAELRSLFGSEPVKTILVPQIRQGDTVTITRGPFQGLETLVTQAAPSSERVRILLELLGNCHEAEIARSDVFKTPPRLLCKA